eukprot:8046371-Pyramimonas_sp.AAC.1
MSVDPLVSLSGGDAASQCPWWTVRHVKRAALRTHIARQHRQQWTLARAWAAPNGQCHACSAT